MEDCKSDIELRSERVRNIVGQIPPILLRRGIVVISIVMILVIAGICFIPYIKTIAVPVTISISPTNTYSGLAFIPQKHSITVKKGARIKIELFDFPASEYGQIIGEISQLHLSNNVGIKADISLPHGLKTSKGYIIDHVPSLGGHAYITISKQPIFHNIIGDFDSK